MRSTRWIIVIFPVLMLTACSSLTESIDSEQTGTPTPTSTSSGSPSMTVTSRFSPTSTSTETISPEPGSVSILAVGDIMMARTVGDRILNDGPEIVFRDVETILSTADILAGNIESAITDRGEPAIKNFTFSAPPASTLALALAGFDIAILGNNHSLDFGQEGLAQTIDLLQEQGIASLGVGLGAEAAGPLLMERNGLRLAFLSYVDVPVELSQFDARAWISTDETVGIAWAIAENIREDVHAAKEQADVVIVFMHFGYEGSELPVGLQREVAVAAIDAGAAAVIGSHPHLLQHVDEYHGGLIAYSLGNFVFDGYGKPQNRSVILKLIVGKSGMVSYDWFPVIIRDGLPQPATPEQAIEILRVLAP
jgi:poly-gamma-glutamate capsule biosynthesis protein CapA/YwtB (metallophosphatase superfamily)